MFRQYMEMKTDFDSQSDMYLYYRNKLSMIEYYYRNYKEGVNVYTSMRDIGELLYKDYYESVGNARESQKD